MTQRNKKQFSCYIEVSQFESLVAMNAATKIPMAVLVREGIDLMLKKRANQLKEA